jgi:hypothetical protein
MKTIIPYLAAALTLAPISAHAAETPSTTSTAISVNVSQPSTPVADVLTSLSHQAGVRILADSTVTDTIGEGRIGASNLEDALNALTKLDPGLTWSRVSLPADAAVPSADDLSAAVRALRKIKAGALTIAGADGSTISINTTSSAQPSGRHDIIVYLVTNETEFDKLANEKANERYTRGGSQAIESTMANLHAIGDTFNQMTPDQQSEVMPLIWQQLRYITRNISPEVLNRFEHSMPQQ